MRVDAMESTGADVTVPFHAIELDDDQATQARYEALQLQPVDITRMNVPAFPMICGKGGTFETDLISMKCSTWTNTSYFHEVRRK